MSDNDTPTVWDSMAVYGRTPEKDELDSRAVWDEEDSLAALDEAMRVIVQGITVEGTQMADEREPLMWGFVNMMHAQMQRLDRAVDRIVPDMRDLQAAQDGTEVKANELELLIDRAQSLGDRRDAFEKMRDMASEAYRAETGNLWRPRHGSHVSRTGTNTQAKIDAQDYQDALKKRTIDALLPEGTLVAVTGGKNVSDPDVIWKELDRALAETPDMVLTHGDAPGVEKVASRWAESKNIKQVVCMPNWKRHKNAAPFRRNDEIIKLQPKALIAFPGSGISDNLVDKARQAGIPVTTASLTASIPSPKPSELPDPSRQPIILNLKQHPDAVQHGAIRIDRETRWSNPFEIGRDGSREEVTTLYAKDLWKRIRSGDVALSDLAALNGKDLACAPNDCHGSVLARAATWAAERLEQKAREDIPFPAADQARPEPTQSASAASDQSRTAASADVAEMSQAPALAAASEPSAAATQTDAPDPVHASESFTSSLQKFMDDDKARDRQANTAAIDRVLLPGFEQHADAARQLLEHTNSEDIPRDVHSSINIALEDGDRYDHAVSATDDICKRLADSLQRHDHLEHLARIRDVEISKVESYDEWLADARQLSAIAENIVLEPEVYDCGFTPEKWQEFSGRLFTLDTALGEDSFFLHLGKLYFEPLPHSPSLSGEALQAHALYRQVRETWHAHISLVDWNDPHPYEDVPFRIVNGMHDLSHNTHLPDKAQAAISSLHNDLTTYRNSRSEVETYLQDIQRSLDTNRGFAAIIDKLDPQKARVEDVEGYGEWQDEAARLVRTGEEMMSKDSATSALYLKHNPQLEKKMKTNIASLKNTLENALPSRTQEIAQQQQVDQHRSISRGMRM